MKLSSNVVSKSTKKLSLESPKLGKLVMGMTKICNCNIVDYCCTKVIKRNWNSRFDWGQSVRKLSGRVIKLLEDQEFLQQERIKARNLNRGIHGFGNLNRRSFPFPDSRPVRLNYNKHLHSASNDRKMAIDEKEEETRKNAKGKLKENGENMEIDHPFSPIKHHRLSQSLLQNNGHSSPPPLQNWYPNLGLRINTLKCLIFT